MVNNKERAPSTDAPSLQSIEVHLINEPFVRIIAMHGGIDSKCDFTGIKRAVKEVVNVTAFIGSCQQIVEIPHRKRTVFSTKIVIMDVCF